MIDGTDSQMPEGGMGDTTPQRVPGGDGGEGHICAHADLLEQNLNDANRFIETIGAGTPEGALFEMRFIPPQGVQVKGRSGVWGETFSLDDVAQVVEAAANANRDGTNVYLCPHPVWAATGKNGTACDDDIISAHWQYADFDDKASVDNYYEFISENPEFEPTFRVITGTNPHERFHAYWRLKEPSDDLNLFRAVQRQIAARFKSDKVVVNPSRVLRIPGFISWPSRKKLIERGYVPELVKPDWRQS